MRKLEDIKNEMLEAVGADPVLSERLTSTSHTAIWRLMISIVAFAIWLHEQIVEKNAENSRPHTLRWYREVALQFLDGRELTWKDGQFKYDTTEMTDAEIEAAKKIEYVALTEASNGKLVIKTAKSGPDFSLPLDAEVHSRFRSYMEQVKDAGNRLEYINQEADVLRLTLTVWVDDMMIDMQTGELLSGPGVFPVREACEGYLNNLEFNGAYIKTFLTDELQAAAGVKIPKVESLRHQNPGNPAEWVEIEEFVFPFAGHFRYADIDITYKKYHEVA